MNQVEALDYEYRHVHQVYQEIAAHFSSTRYKPWPIIHSFLTSQPPGSIGIDAGCGNGKYLPHSISTVILASDRSENLVQIAALSAQASTKAEERPSNFHAALLADSTALPHPDGRFDFGISIAVVHHFSTRGRRVKAIAELLRCMKSSKEVGFGGKTKQDVNSGAEGSCPRSPGGKALIFVWALEQSTSRRGWDINSDQDTLVPWVSKSTQNKKEPAGTQSRDQGNGDGTSEQVDEQIYKRYYHLYRQGELEEDVESAGGTVLESGYEKDNWWAVAGRVEKE